MSDDESRDMTISQNDGGRTKFLGKRFRDLGEGPNGALTAEQAQAARRGESGKAIDFGEGRRTPDERGPPAPPAPPGPPPKGAASARRPARGDLPRNKISSKNNEK